MAKKDTVLITGATGFVGRRLVAQIVKHWDKDNVVCLAYDKDTFFETEGQSLLKKFGVNIVKGDLLKPRSLSSLPQKPSLTIHLAAETNTAKNNHDVNSVGTKNLLKAIGPLGKESHFIHISTMVIAAGRLNCEKPISESTPDYPSNEYTRTKLSGEKTLLHKCQEDNFRLTIIRPNTIYGKNVRKNSLFDMVKEMIENNSLVTRINWPGKSALIHVDDFVEFILRTTKSNPKPGTPNNFLVYTENLSISDISKTMHKALGITYKPIALPKAFWSIGSWGRRFIFPLENILPANLYNQLWRTTIITDHAVNCKTSKAQKEFGEWRNKYFEEYVKDVL
ncbi:NAD-dependent epimerase/dehydratase family protein [Patescibacteria group bacterium]